MSRYLLLEFTRSKQLGLPYVKTHGQFHFELSELLSKTLLTFRATFAWLNLTKSEWRQRVCVADGHSVVPIHRPCG